MNRDREPTDVRLELLVVRCQRGDRKAFEELVEAWERKLFVFVRKLVPDEEATWQVLQETWLQVIRGIASIRDPGRFRVWLYRVARNTTMSHLRVVYAQPASIEGDVADGEPDSIEFEDADLVHYGLSRLSIQDREVLTLFFLDDLSIGETAEVLGIPPGTVKSRLHKAKRALRDVLDREGGRHG